MEIVSCDAMEFIKSLPSDFADLVILDPDYQLWNKFIKCGLIDEAVRILKDTGNIVCFVKQPFDYDLRNAVNKYFRREIVWTFENGGAWVSNRMPLVSFQKIYILSKSKKPFFNPRTGIGYSEKTRDFKRKNKVFCGYDKDGKEFKRSEDGVWIRDHLHYNKPQCGNIPAKPQELCDILVKCFCPSDGVVVDPFTGSGTFIFSAYNQGKDVFACDIDNERIDAILDKMFTECTEQGMDN